MAYNILKEVGLRVWQHQKTPLLLCARKGHICSKSWAWTVRQTSGTQVVRHLSNWSTGASTSTYLSNKVALVTGSTSGIGLGVARGLALRGCDIILNGFADEQLIQKLTDEFETAYKSKVTYEFADLSKADEVEDLSQRIFKHYPAGVDIIINNAGFQHVSPVEDFALEKWNAMIAVMLTTPFQLIKAFVPAMREKGWGRIVNISSVHGLKASPNKTGYCSAKHGILGLTKAVSLETAGSGITCNAICPGYVNTPILQGQVKTLSEKDNIPYDEAQGKFLAQFHPSKAPVGIDHLAEMVAFLCTETGSQITGSSLVIDGGWSAK